MKLSQIFVALLSIGVLELAIATPSSRLLNGENSTPNEFPHVVSVRVNNIHVCVGNILSENWIITAAHCVSKAANAPIDVESVTVRVGSTNRFSGGRIVNVTKINTNPTYNSFLHDITLLKLNEKLVFGDKIQKIEIAKEKLIPGSKVTVPSWGKFIAASNPLKLQNATFTIMNPLICELELGYGYSSVVCLEHGINEGISAEDAGAGSIVHGKLYSLVSFPYADGSTAYPDISILLSYYDIWIQNVMKYN